ncbi:hypothetical protein ASPBRDRAFT_293634 [Aspergillus brasiliensis CBS 101740]|uniref:Uncharacterized protein n=1 Tax=Aspergillus brasiliensis (strain CBS 101740 / IMI 381727 / IBT 21946) TaxID=767769 RepID=A0A1L9UBU6_ASPBC|nr:hypothetical protein ASPBRDRAFT_293634 [Aspergillus brasiliensis CBS 101740]
MLRSYCFELLNRFNGFISYFLILEAPLTYSSTSLDCPFFRLESTLGCSIWMLDNCTICTCISFVDLGFQVCSSQFSGIESIVVYGKIYTLITRKAGTMYVQMGKMQCK